MIRPFAASKSSGSKKVARHCLKMVGGVHFIQQVDEVTVAVEWTVVEAVAAVGAIPNVQGEVTAVFVTSG